MPAKGNATDFAPQDMSITIVNEKKIIVNNILKATVVTGGILVGVTAIRDIQAGVSLLNSIANALALLILLLALIFSRQISLDVKTWLVIAVFNLVGIKHLLVNGLSGSTFYCFLVSGVIALLIFERSAAIYTIIAITFIYITFITLSAIGIFTPVVESEKIQPYVRWLREIFSYTFTLFIVIGGIGRLHRSFLFSIHSLDESNQKLNQYNEELRNQLEYSKAMEDKVTEKEINFKTLFEESNDGILVCDATGTIVEANKAIASMLSYPKSYLIGTRSVDFVISDDKRGIKQLSIDKIHSAKIRELQIVSREGVRIPVEVNYSVISFKERKSILVTVRDIRERKQTEQKVLSAVIEAEENERSRFAKDLHDDLGPILSSIKMYIQSLRHHEDAEEKKELINRLVGTVDDSIKSIRKISYNLSSHLLQNMGLINALKTHIERINLSSAFKITLNHNFENEQRLTSNIEIVTYRVLLELVKNTITHSQGSKITIDLNLVAGHFIITYSDNGTGFDIDKMLRDNSKGIGLRNILSRVKSVKGLVNFDTDRSGFSLTIDINL